MSDHDDQKDVQPPGLPLEGYVRLRQIIKPHGVLPISRSRWYTGIAAGEFPRPRKLGTVSLWESSAIRALLRRIGADG